MPAPDIVVQLVERFDRQLSAYRSGEYNETQLRREFLDPFLEALGWDVGNSSGTLEPFKDVIHEDRIRVEETAKAPDYGICVGGVRKFFVEAKKPSVNIEREIGPAYQLRRYAWSAKLPLSVLTDFEELAVYDCRSQPKADDKASVARVMFFRYTEYIARWDELTALFSKDAVRAGSLDKYAEETRTRRGTVEVDEAFLEEIESWRAAFAHDIACNNPALTQRELNWAVQRTIDRIVFLRICEARGIEDFGQLQNLAVGDGIYSRLVVLFGRADEKYNSGLFHFRSERGRQEAPDKLTPGLAVSDHTLRQVIARLYFPVSSYEFSVLPADILGQVYERFLGKVIRLTDTHDAVVEVKPEVRKAGGVYYTPSHIVDYIVRQTVGQLVSGYRPGPRGGASRLRILDPACGSGSFLLGAYQYLLDWHLEQYLLDGPESHRDVLVTGPGGEWRLSTPERKRILLNNIFGVDIDAQAVETTKLSLLLKVLEGETDLTVTRQLALFHERALPDLENNIKSGNSLVGTDFYTAVQLSVLTEEVRHRVNPFDWRAEFSDAVTAGGFDAVIGNPPYIFGEYHDEHVKEYLTARYRVAQGQYDTYSIFVEKSIELLSPKGRLGMIIPDALLARDEVAVVRDVLLSNGLERVYHCGLVFNAGVSAVVVTLEKGRAARKIVSEVRKGTGTQVQHACSRNRFEDDPRKRLLIHASDEEASIIEKISAYGKTLEPEYMNISRGEEIGKKFVLDAGPVPILVGEDIRPYYVANPTRFVRGITKRPELYAGPKLVIVKTGARCVAGYDPSGVVTMQSVYNVHTSDQVSDLVLLAILNSKLISFLVAKTFTAYKLLFPQLNQTTLGELPAPRDIRKSETAIERAVEQMIALQRELVKAGTAHEKTAIKRQLEAVGRQIDRLVYELYELEDREVRLVEAAMAEP
ncbi:MAG TPA: TaqI-like C-terminal specificity domain-containing protein [Longimicrobium sp.]|jgi:hypothetical protein